MLQGTIPTNPGPGHPAYWASLKCPACGEASHHRVLRARQTLTIALPGRPFDRALGWTEEFSRTEDSPFYYGLCLCPLCQFVGGETDFRDDSGPSRGPLARFFVEQRAGVEGTVAAILGQDPAAAEEPERTLRWTLAAIRIETLPYPELWRKREIGRLYLRLASFYLDEAHLDWSGRKPAEAPDYLDVGPGAARLQAALAAVAPACADWPEAPLTAEVARQEALRYHREAYETRPDDPEPEEAILEERQVAELCGMNGDLAGACEMWERAIKTATRVRVEQLQRQQAVGSDMDFTLAERRALTAQIQRLARLREELVQDGRTAFGFVPGEKRPAARTASARPAEPARKRRFRLFG